VVVAVALMLQLMEQLVGLVAEQQMMGHQVLVEQQLHHQHKVMLVVMLLLILLHILQVAVVELEQ
jgi:hypothetical protein